MCWKCGKAITIDGPIGRTATCASCGADVRSCRNCRFWSPGSFHDCAERVEDSVSDKERANFCDSFQLNPKFRKDRPSKDGISGDSPAAQSGRPARTAFEDLFRQ